MGVCVFCEGTGTSRLGNDPCPLIHSGPCDACQEIEALGTQISEAEKVLSDLHKKQQDARLKLNSRHDRLLNKIPPEILARIFEFVVGAWSEDGLWPKSLGNPFDRGISINDDDDNGMGAVFVAPLFLGSICHRWREIAWSSPELWTLPVVEIDIIRTETWLTLIAEWLMRSGSLPLSLHVLARDTCSSDSITLKTLNIISQVSDRWKNLTLIVPPHILSSIAWHRAISPSLSKLSLDIIGSPNEMSKLNFHLSLPAVSSLRDVDLSGISPLKCNFHWKDISTLSLRRTCF